MKLTDFLVSLLLIVFCGSANAESWHAKMVDYGTYESGLGGKVSDNAVAGDLTISFGKKLIKQSEEVTAKIGSNFGFRYTLTGPKDEVEVTIRVIHPFPLKDPVTGKEFAKSEWSQEVPINHENWNTGWNFENDWEIVPGKWVMQLLIKDKVILEKTFLITDGRKR